MNYIKSKINEGIKNIDTVMFGAQHLEEYSILVL